jgi:hypothetical protein
LDNCVQARLATSGSANNRLNSSSGSLADQATGLMMSDNPGDCGSTIRNMKSGSRLVASARSNVREKYFYAWHDPSENALKNSKIYG